MRVKLLGSVPSLSVHLVQLTLGRVQCCLGDILNQRAGSIYKVEMRVLEAKSQRLNSVKVDLSKRLAGKRFHKFWFQSPTGGVLAVSQSFSPSLSFSGLIGRNKSVSSGLYSFLAVRQEQTSEITQVGSRDPLNRFI